jgi:hypothetical protein
MKVHGKHNPLKLYTISQLDDYADNLKLLETKKNTIETIEIPIDATGEAGNN